jgi:hypothetical protein
MKTLMQMLDKLCARLRPPRTEEQYLARAADAQDFQVRQRALEHARP